MNIGALEKFIMKLKSLDKMPIGSAVRKVGGQLKQTGKAMASNPRAALGGAALGAGGTAYKMSEDDDDGEEPSEEELMELLAQRGYR